jgi:hypothetical protein
VNCSCIFIYSNKYIAPSTATNKILKYTSEHPEFVTVDENTGAIHGASVFTIIDLVSGVNDTPETRIGLVLN